MSPRGGDRGSGVLSAAFGLLVFLLLLLFAVQVVHSLHATSVVTGAAYDAARTVAGYDSVADRVAAAQNAEAVLRERLPGYDAASLVVQWGDLSDPEEVTLVVHAVHLSAWPRALDPLNLGELHRRITVRTEAVR